MVPGAGSRGKIGRSFHYNSHWMNTMYRCALAAIVAATSLVAPASAQNLRVFPPNTLRGAMIFGDYPNVSLNGQATRLSPGSRLRGADNMAVMPTSVAGAKLLVHYTVDLASNVVKDVWILTPDEAAIKPWPSTLEEARTWTYDPTTRTWTKP
jgi:hypothetical protein